MRKWINLFESSGPQISADETKFWLNARTGQFINHDNDTHHTKVVAQRPDEFGLSVDDVAHHPHHHGDYRLGWDTGAVTDPDDWDGDEDYTDDDDVEFADNDDMGMFEKAYALGWVRGGHEIDIMQYFDFGEVRHEGAIYLQSSNIRDLQKAVAICWKTWPEIEYFRIELPGRYTPLMGDQQIKAFIRYGTFPRTQP